jgi:phage terminase large subunit GpA-like protein
MKWNGGTNADPDQVETGTWVECAVCREKIEHSDKAWMGSCGKWVSEGQGITAEAVMNGGMSSPSGVRFVANITPGRVSRKVGFQIPMGVSPFSTWGKIARGYVAAKGSPPPVWWNGQIGRAWQVRGERAEIDDLKKLVRPIAQGGHEFGRVPAKAVFLCAAIDVQGDRVWYQVDAFGPEMEWSGMVDCGYLPSAYDDNLYVVDKLIQRSWKVQGDDSTSLRCLYWGIDSGEGRRTGEVYRAVKRSRALAHTASLVAGSLPLPKLYAIKGDGYSTSPKPWRLSELTEHGVSLLLVKNVYYKDIISAAHAIADREKLTNREDQGGFGAEMSGLAGRRVLPVGTPPEYFSHYTCEERLIVNNKAVWQKRDGRLQNHLFDCGKYLYCLAEFLDGRGVGEQSRGAMWARMSVERPPTKAEQKSPFPRGDGSSQGIGFVARASEMRRGKTYGG